MKRILVIAVAVLMLGGNAYAQSSADATAVNQQSQGSVGTQTATTSAVAQQGQLQGQTQQAAGGTVANSGNSAIGISNSFNGSAPIRYLPVPSAVPMESYQPAILSRPDYADKGPNFMSMRQIVGMMNYVDLDAEVEGESKMKINMQVMQPKKVEKFNKYMKSTKGAKYGKVTFDINDGKKVNGGFEPIAIITLSSEKPNKVNSAMLAMLVGKRARAMGASKVIFLTEGSTKVLSSWGVGIGLSYNSATVDSKPSGSGSVGSGGTGWSMGKARYYDHIYLTAVVGN